MQTQKSLINYFEKIILPYSVVSISGESGTGKTSFALYLVGNMVNSPSCCIWIQASEPFPKTRLEAMFRNDQEKTNYLLKNTLIAPPRPNSPLCTPVLIIANFKEAKILFKESVNN